MHVRLDPVGGIAGDMFAAAVLDAWPELESELIAALERAGISRLASVRRVDHADHALTGSRFEVSEVEGASSHHRHYREICEFIRSADLAEPIAVRTLDVFDRLARAESQVHGVEVEDVSFHEVGQWDSIADIVSATWLIEALGDASWSCAPLPLGQGRVESAHGTLPIPAPATAILLEGIPTFHDHHLGERVTPTGAAIVAHLNPSFDTIPGVVRLARSGTGFGTRVFEGLSNTLRVLAFESETASGVRHTERVSVCSFEIDDQTGEDLAVALDRVRAVAGVLDVTQSPVYGKKGRLAVQVQVLVRPDALQDTLDACFQETATLGIRWHTVERAVLGREEHALKLGDERVRVKRAHRPGDRVSAKAEMDDLSRAGGGRVAREKLRLEAEAMEVGGDDVGGTRAKSDAKHGG